MDDIGNSLNNKNFILTLDDVNNLTKSSGSTKVNITKKIASHYKAGGFNSGQMEIAEQIFELLVKDTQVGIRQALSEVLKDAKDIPKDIVVELANDIEEVSLPVVEFSKILSDKDLIEIVANSESTAKKVAIAKRDDVTENLSNALIEHSTAEVVDTLLHNKSAKVSEEGYNNIVSDYANNEEVLGALIERDRLPVNVLEHLASAVSDAICDRLAKKHSSSFEKIDKIIQKGKVLATKKVIESECSDYEYGNFLGLMDSMSIAKDLFPIFALSMGNLALFEAHMARITKISVANIKTLVKDQSNKGVRALYTKAKLPEEMYLVTELMIEVIREMSGNIKSYGIFASEESAIDMIELIQQKAQLFQMLDKEVNNLDYVLTLVEKNAKSG